jgi:hypothetical protein
VELLSNFLVLLGITVPQSELEPPSSWVLVLCLPFPLIGEGFGGSFSDSTLLNHGTQTSASTKTLL